MEGMEERIIGSLTILSDPDFTAMQSHISLKFCLQRMELEMPTRSYSPVLAAKNLCLVNRIVNTQYKRTHSSIIQKEIIQITAPIMCLSFGGNQEIWQVFMTGFPMQRSDRVSTFFPLGTEKCGWEMTSGQFNLRAVVWRWFRFNRKKMVFPGQPCRDSTI